jgi:4-hydroxy-tetrahydrodipicolinate reductase
MLKIGIIGITGKMGKEVLFLLSKEKNLCLSGAITRSKNPFIGKHLSYLYPSISSDVLIENDIYSIAKKSDVLVDISHKESLKNILSAATKEKKAVVIGTTGYEEKDFLQIKEASKIIPIFYSANFSLQVALFKKFLSFIPKKIIDQNDIDIIEMHHKEKKDSPSGTALMLAKTIQSNTTPSIHSIRSGKIFGEHKVLIQNDDEAITIEHRAFSRKAFASGIITAINFIKQKEIGLFTIEDLFCF